MRTLKISSTWVKPFKRVSRGTRTPKTETWTIKPELAIRTVEQNLRDVDMGLVSARDLHRIVFCRRQSWTRYRFRQALDHPFLLLPHVGRQVAIFHLPARNHGTIFRRARGDIFSVDWLTSCLAAIVRMQLLRTVNRWPCKKFIESQTHLRAQMEETDQIGGVPRWHY